MRPTELPEYNRAAAERYLNRDQSKGPAPPSGPEDVALDADVSLQSLFSAFVQILYPEPLITDFTVRAEALRPEERHIFSLSYVARVGVALNCGTLGLIWIVRLAPEFVPQFALPLAIQSLAAAGLHLLFGRAWSDLTPFLAFFALCFGLLAVVAHPEHLFAAECLVLHGIILWGITGRSASHTLRRAVILICSFVAAIAVAFPEGTLALCAVPILLAGVGIRTFSSVFVPNCLRWMLFSRAATLEVIAGWQNPDDDDQQVAERRERTAMLESARAFAEIAWGTALFLFLLLYRALASAVWLQLFSPLALLVEVLLIHAAHWLFVEIAFHRRVPDVSAFFRSFYVVWRTLTVWLAYLPALKAPMVFDFPRPWTSPLTRRFAYRITFVFCSALLVGVAWDWSTQYSASFLPPEMQTDPASGPRGPDVIPGGSVLVPAAYFVSQQESYGPEPTADEALTPSRSASRISSKAFYRLLDYRFALLFLAYLAVIPPVLFWISLAAICGPALTAAHDRFELRDESVEAPDFTKDATL